MPRPQTLIAIEESDPHQETSVDRPKGFCDELKCSSKTTEIAKTCTVPSGIKTRNLCYESELFNKKESGGNYVRK